VTLVTTAFVLSGGGNLGAVQAGQLRALFEAGVRPDLIVGTSVGALNGAFLAGACDTDGCDALAELWRGIRRADVFPARPLIGLSGFLGRRSSFVPDTGLRKLLNESVRFRSLEDAPIPLHVVACELRTGNEVLLSTGDTIDAICASAAIPAVFPPVEIDGRTLVDGGIANNAPISHALDLGVDTVWVLPCGYACAIPTQPRGALGIALQAVSVLVQQRLAIDIRRYSNDHDIRVAPSPCPVNVMPTDFSQSEQLMSDAYDTTRAWLDAGRPAWSTDRVTPHRH
jgi:NTE family protein